MLFEPRQTLHAPHLLDIEVTQVIRRYAAEGEIDGERGFDHGVFVPFLIVDPGAQIPVVMISL